MHETSPNKKVIPKHTITVDLSQKNKKIEGYFKRNLGNQTYSTRPREETQSSPHQMEGNRHN